MFTGRSREYTYAAGTESSGRGDENRQSTQQVTGQPGGPRLSGVREGLRRDRLAHHNLRLTAVPHVPTIVLGDTGEMKFDQIRTQKAETGTTPYAAIRRK